MLSLAWIAYFSSLLPTTPTLYYSTTSTTPRLAVRLEVKRATSSKNQRKAMKCLVEFATRMLEDEEEKEGGMRQVCGWRERFGRVGGVRMSRGFEGSV